MRSSSRLPTSECARHEDVADLVSHERASRRPSCGNPSFHTAHFTPRFWERSLASSPLCRYREALPAGELPDAVLRRPNCWYGSECRTQVHNRQHAERLNHICGPSRGSMAAARDRGRRGAGRGNVGGSDRGGGRGGVDNSGRGTGAGIAGADGIGGASTSDRAHSETQ